jgi:predicted dienelactone hydrolase
MLTLLPLLVFGCVDQVVTCEAAPGDGAGDPYASGPYRVETSTFKVDVASRRRSRPLDVYLPQGREDAPLVVFHHGFAAPRSLYHRTACHMAGWGLATVMPQWDESFVFSQDHSELREDSVALLPALEMLETLDQVDVDKLGVAGHSRGGKQALFHALDEDRVRAVFAIDPVDSGSPFGDPDPVDFPLVSESLAALEIPTGLLGAGRGGETFDGGVISAPCAPVEGNYEVLFEASTAPTTLWTLPEAGHSDFADPCAEDPEACEPCVAGSDPGQARAVAGALAVSFFRLHLEGEQEQEQWLTGSGLPEDVVLDQR